MSTPSKIHSHRAPGRGAVALDAAALQDPQLLPLLEQQGIFFGHAGDSLYPPNFPAGIPNLLQFFTNIAPGLVKIVTTPRRADDLIGVDVVGSWEDEHIITRLMESLGVAAPYTDEGNIPLASYNPGAESRTIVRFESGFKTGPLEEARGTKSDYDVRAEKRAAAVFTLDYTRNLIAFRGYNDGQNRTFGILNDPGLPAFVTVPAGDSGDTEWATKTFLEITADIRLFMSTLRTRSGDTVDPNTAQITFALPPSAMDAWGIVADIGTVSVIDWLNNTYRNVRVISVPEFENANAGESVAMIWADSAPEGDGSTDNGRTWMQMVPERLRMIGSETGAKHYVEDHSNATAGVILKRPFLVAAFQGL